MLSYQPLQNYRSSTIYNDGTNRNFILYSQRPRALIYPSLNEGVEMTLPFLWPYQYLHASLAQDFTDMGVLDLNYLTQLQSANGATGAGITLQFYAWAEDVVVTGPTVGLALQSQDEYVPNGTISGPASAIAGVASKLETLPVIGRFARATSIGASAVSSIAKLFGFTDVPQIGDVQAFQPKGVPMLASTEVGFPVEKLTVDAKNELSIDPSIVGHSNQDELVISSIVGKESYLAQFAWDTTQGADTLLWNQAISPSTFYMASTSVQNALYMTPLAFASTMFKYWRGDVILRFRVVCSQYHKGRMRISYDPDGYAAENIASDATSSTVVFNEIVDISSNTDVEVRIPFSQYLAWCQTDIASYMTPANSGMGAVSTFFHRRGYTNGSLVVRVSTALTAPVTTSTISVLIFVRGAENLEFAAPSLDGSDRLSVFPLQSDDEIVQRGEEGQDHVVVGAPVSPTDHLYLTYMGEAVRSFRTLMRRKCLINILSPRGSSGDYCVVYNRLYRMPFMFGYDPTGVETAKGLIATTTDEKFNWSQNNYLSYINQCFLGHRGSVNWVVVPVAGTGGNVPQYMRVYRKPTATSMGQAYVSTGAPTNYGQYWFTNSDNGSAGQVVGTRFNNAISFQMPYYSNRKFATNDPQSFTDVTDDNHENDSQFVIENIFSSTNGTKYDGSRLHVYAAAGTDFTSIFFLNVPTFYVLTSIPAP
ncbi:hypothetical protein 2 [Wenzhou picorna-like virus 12]|uniref:hypothetical protein 2 n=1 Tax=Wenzhou picorna-like virus 12 TaxID=1923596 RepID=UPI00090ACA42|nr:hypothetical protein 2 [Wenzhou picorna-like virus 12]APG78522.1 hypothetical protein 2 [Wenzhou picorna-like virus 12]